MDLYDFPIFLCGFLCLASVVVAVVLLILLTSLYLASRSDDIEEELFERMIRERDSDER